MAAISDRRAVSDEDLRDHWFIQIGDGMDGMIPMREEMAAGILEAISENTHSIFDTKEGHLLSIFVAPLFYDFVDLYGSVGHVRLDRVTMVGHMTPESRAIDRQHDALLMAEAEAEGE